jgi:Nuclease-related domain
MVDKTRSPIKGRPLRAPGQSLEDARRNLVEDKIEQPLLIALFLVLMTMFEWWRAYTNQPPQPFVLGVAAASAIGIAIWRFVRVRPEFKQLRQAIDGEKVVGQFLDTLREHHYHVFHDLIGDGFNVDHVLIGPAGVFTIETKTWSKPLRGEARIKFDGENITRGSLAPERNPVVQARAQAGWLANLLAESTGKPFDVHPVVVFPGWFIEQTQTSARRIWVLNPKALPQFLMNEPQRLIEDDVRLASFHLSRLIRVSEEGRQR